jgi:hypothetical protein
LTERCEFNWSIAAPIDRSIFAKAKYSRTPYACSTAQAEPKDAAQMAKQLLGLLCVMLD